MASTNFIPGTLVTSTWLNEIDTHVFDGKRFDSISGINVLNDGTVIGDGVTNDTASIQAIINTLEDGDTIIFPKGIYKIGRLVFDGLDKITVIALGARFNLTGDNAGFVVKGVVTQMDVYGGVIVGDGTNRDADVSKAQIGWLVGNEVGAFVQSVRFWGVWVDAANIGFKCAYGTGTGSGVARHMKFVNCHVKDIVGTVSGNGYGFQLSQAPDSVLTNCTADNCQRHAIYLAEGRNYAVTNCIIKNHRSTVFDGGWRVALSISRSRNVTVSGCVFDTCYDGTIAVDVDGAGLAPDNVANGVAISNCTFLESALADVRIGTDSPSTEGVCRNVVVSGCVSVRKSGDTLQSVVIEAGYRVKIVNFTVDALTSNASFKAFSLNGRDGTSYTDNVEISGCTVHTVGFGVQIASALQTGTSRIRISNNNFVATAGEFDFVGGENATTNNNLLYKRTSGFNATRAYTSSGTNITIPAGGCDVIWLAASGATTVQNFSGGTTGQRLTLYFTNGNTTIKNTNIYLAGAVDFVGSANDTLTLMYVDSLWQEVGRSVN